MKMTLESTSKLTMFQGIECRIWEGTTAAGVAVYALIPQVAHHKDDDAAEFERDLREHKEPSRRALASFDPRYFLD